MDQDRSYSRRHHRDDSRRQVSEHGSSSDYSKHKRRSRSRSHDRYSSSRSRRVEKQSNFSKFSDRPPEEPKAKMSTQEILDYYKQYNPNQGLTNHNKSERQLYIGNIPPGLSVPQLMELLNTTLKEMGKEADIFQDGDPVVGSWISGDGHYAFVDFKSADDATQAFVLQQVSIHGNNLKVGRPKNATGPIPTPNQLLAGNPNFNLGGGVTANTNRRRQPGGLQNAMRGDGNQAISTQNTKLMVTNFPSEYSKESINKICEVFGKIKHIDILKDPATGEFKGHIHVEYETEMDAKKGFAGMMGLKVEDNVLFVKRMTTINAPTASMEGEVFKSLIEDKPTPCLIMRNVVKIEEIESRDDYKELEYDVEDEMNRYGKCLKVHVPRPPLFGDPNSVPGFGKCYVRFSSENEAEKAKHSLFRRRFNGRAVDVFYYPEEKFMKNHFD